MANFAPHQRYSPHIVLADQGDSDLRQRNAGRITTEHAMTEEERVNFLRNIQKVQENAQVPVYFHPHCGSRIETVEETEWLLANDPDIRLVFDTGHLLYASRGEADLVGLLQSWQERIGTFHFKVQEILNL